MLNLTEEQRQFLRDNFEDAEKMMHADSVNDILLPLDALITYQGFDSDYLPTAWGSRAESIYGQIYNQNPK